MSSIRPATTCQRCGSDQIAFVSAKCPDGVMSESPSGVWVEATLVPLGVGLGSSGEYVDVCWCLDCGQLQGKFPIPAQVVKDAYEHHVPPKPRQSMAGGGYKTYAQRVMVKASTIPKMDMEGDTLTPEEIEARKAALTKAKEGGASTRIEQKAEVPSAP